MSRTSLTIAAVTIAAAIAVPGVATAAAPALSARGASDLAATLGDARTAGVYVDGGQVTVAVTDSAAADAVRAAGATPRMVTRSARQLNEFRTRMDTATPGTAWSVDPTTNQVVITADSTVGAADVARLTAAAANSGGAARLERTAGALTPLTTGGDAIYGGGYRCSLGFNVRSGSTYYFLTAGHCTDAASEWFANSSHTTKLGDRTGTSFPGNDYGIVKYTNTSITIGGSVGGQDIASAADAYIGESVSRRGSTTGTRSGTVTGLDATVHYSGGGTVRGMIKTNVCAEPGDSGGPLYDGSIALGLTSGGSGNCQQGGTTFYQPVTEALAKYRVSVF